MLTYGDGVSDVDLPALLAHHRASGQARDGDGRATRVAVRRPELRGRRARPLHREAADRRGLGQRRVHGPRAGGPLVHRGRRLELRVERARTDLRGGSARRVSATRASGRRWTPSATSATCGRCGPTATRRGGHGSSRPWSRSDGPRSPARAGCSVGSVARRLRRRRRRGHRARRRLGRGRERRSGPMASQRADGDVRDTDARAEIARASVASTRSSISRRRRSSGRPSSTRRRRSATTSRGRGACSRPAARRPA